MTSTLVRRGFLRTAAALPLLGSAIATAQDSRTLTIAHHTALPGLDATRNAQTSNPAVQSIYKAIFDPYIDQNPDLSLKPGILTKWGWTADRRGVVLTMRRGALWHDGTPVTREDLVWSLERAADPKTGNPMNFVWKKLGRARIDGDTVTVELKEPEPAMVKWLAFLTAYILPRKAFTEAGPEGWDDKPVGSGPYRVEKFERNGYIRLMAFPQYWGPKPAFETVIFKFVPDPATRVAEVESGASDLTLEAPLRGVRPPAHEAQSRRREDAGVGCRTAAAQQQGAAARSQRATGRIARHRQEDADRQVVARLRYAARHLRRWWGRSRPGGRGKWIRVCCRC